MGVRRLFCGFLLVFTATVNLSIGQSSSEAGEVSLMSHEYDSALWEIADLIYNLQHKEAEEAIEEVRPLLEAHPIYHFLVSLNIVWETIPEVVPRDFERLEYHLNAAIEKSEKRLEKNSEDPEGILFGVLAHGLLAQYYNVQNQTFKAISEARKAYSAVISGFDYIDVYNEFLFSSGLYNYYREKYPEIYPVYKPFVWVFKSGDIEAGLKQLERAIKETTLARVEAVNYLAYIYLRYEEKPRDALRILKPVIERYPDNLYFKVMYLEGKMFLGEIEENNPMVLELINSSRKYYRMCGYSYKGFVNSKSGHLEEAMFYYNKSLQLGQDFELVGYGAKSFDHAGLARIYDEKGKTEYARRQYEKVLEYAVHPFLRKEAKEYLRTH